MKRLKIALPALVVLLFAGCGTGPVRRVSEPTANIQQLTVRADGSWSVDLRIENYSSVPMRFDGVSLAVTAGDQAAGTLQASPALSIGPESGDVASVSLVPAAAARIVIADALARGRGITYTLDGTIAAAAQGAGTRTYKVKRANALNPVPGLPGVMR